MPKSPPTICTEPGCPNHATEGGRCPAHKRKAWRTTTTSSAARGYGERWRRIRAMKLRNHPVCEVCRLAPATQVDHIKAKAHGGDDYDPDNLQSICRPCHQAKTSTEGKRRRTARP